MHKIDNSTAVNNQFVDGDPLRGVIATRLTARWLNTVQNEIANVILLAGMVLNKSSDRQLYDAIKKIAADTPLANHTHEIAGINGLQTALNDKANSSHTHEISSINGLQTALNDKANSNHGHGIAGINGLQTALNDKANSSHGHTLEINGNQIRIDGGEWKSLPTPQVSTTIAWNNITSVPTTFPPSSHSHSEYAPNSHSHSGYAAEGHLHNDLYVQINTGAQQKGAVAWCKNTSANLSGGEMVSGAKLYPACSAMDGTVAAQGSSLPGTWVSKGYCLLNHCANFERVL